MKHLNDGTVDILIVRYIDARETNSGLGGHLHHSWHPTERELQSPHHSTNT